MENFEVKKKILVERPITTKKEEVESHPLVNELEELGFLTASKKVEKEDKKAKELSELKRRATLAYERYRFITPANIERFNKILEKKTYVAKGPNGYPCFDRLKFTSINHYGQVPPKSVLEKVREAKREGLFDAFEVCTIETHEVRPDPIIFGIIRNCEDKFFIDQWDNDVKIEDIISPMEG